MNSKCVGILNFARRSAHHARNSSLPHSELRDVRNRWAHYEDLSVAQAYRTVDTAQILLETVDAAASARLLDGPKTTLLTAMNQGLPDSVVSGSDSGQGVTEPERQEKPEGGQTAGGTAEIRLKTSATPLNYALMRRGLSVVESLSIDWTGPELQGASVEISVEAEAVSLGDPTVHIVDLRGGDSVEIPDHEVRLDARRMSSVDTVQDGAVRVAVRHPDGTLLGSVTEVVRIWPPRFWAATVESMDLSSELLASFVQPQAPIIDELLREASQKLTELGYGEDLDAYQQGEGSAAARRVDEIVEAIYEAMRARQIRYANPPAGWRIGQAIRTPDEVLIGGVGTCMDTTLVMAAALEQAGIHPQLWLVPGHIFLGYWRNEDGHFNSLSSCEPDDIATALNHVGSNALTGPVGFVETTMLTSQAESSSFAYAREHAFVDHVTQSTPHFEAIVDVRIARFEQVYPLPSRSISASGEVTVHEYHAASAPKTEIYSTQQARQYVAPGQKRVPARVRQWKNSLLDLSLRNKLLNYTSRKGHSLAVPSGIIADFEDMVSEGRQIELIPDDRFPSVRQLDGIDRGSKLPDADRATLLKDDAKVYVDKIDGVFQRSLRDLATKARTIVDETGANNLYLALGRLKWNVGPKNLHSPLILVPVNLTVTARGTRFTLTLDDSGESTPNYCLLEKLKVERQLDIPALANPMRDDAGIDITSTLAEVRKALAAAQVPFTVEETVDLAILDFAKFRLWKDLDESWETLAENDVVRHLIETPTEAFKEPVSAPLEKDLDELVLNLPVPADASQADAVSEAVEGRTFVLEGPPGTGKSQTITNLLSHAMGEGKTVLFVAEKRAALDVVKDRLDGVGLGDFALDLHDKSAKLSAVRAQIRSALDAAVRADETGLQTQRELARSSRGSLKRYADRLHAPNAAGFSLYSARVKALATDESIETLPVPERFVAECAEEQVAEVRRVLRFLPEYVDMTVPRPQHPWAFLRDPAAIVDESSALEVVDAFDVSLAIVQKHGIAPVDLDKRNLAELGSWSGAARIPREPLERFDSFAALSNDGTIEALRQEIEVLLAQRQDWATAVHPGALDTDVEALHAAAVSADESGFFSRKKRRRDVRQSLAAYFIADPEQFDLKWLSTLTADIERTGLMVRDLRRRLQELPLPVVDSSWNPFVHENGREAVEKLTETSNLAKQLRIRQPGGEFIREYFANTQVDGSLAEALDGYLDAHQRLVAQFDLPTDSESGQVSLDGWTGEDGFVDVWLRTSAERGKGDSASKGLRHWREYLLHVAPLRAIGLEELWKRAVVGDVRPEDAVLGFERGLAEASVTERTRASLLTSFDPKSHSNSIGRFANASAEVRGELPRALPAAILKRRRFDPQNENGKLGELRRQLNRQRGGMKVRELFEKYGSLLTDIMPCVLTSPESVARYFPPKAGLFDVVVFDEASQIRVADAVGALGRARSAVVVGDSKQMPPTSFGESNVDEVVEEDVVVDEESILSECVQSRIPRKWLSWHYRSQNEGLIFFSNHAYYENRLSSFPAPSGASEERGVSLVPVDGQFLRSATGAELRTNPVEARAIAAEVERRFAASPGTTPSLGIITFNAYQRAYVEGLLRDLPDERIAMALEERDGLFVKNLENVQGDERDVILFSVAFSKNEKGVLPLNFGPLSRSGGERRLNVAITRARRQVVLYASFDPEDLRVESTASVGLKHLRSYLELARAGADHQADTSGRQPVLDRHRDEIAEGLRDRGFAVTTDVGLSDFRVDITIAAGDARDAPLAAVLLDGEGWRERRTVADRDGLPVEVLKGLMHWPVVERVWLPEWLQQRDATLDRLASAVEEARLLVEKRATGPQLPEPPTAGPGLDSWDREPALQGSPQSVPASSDPDVRYNEQLPAVDSFVTATQVSPAKTAPTQASTPNVVAPSVWSGRARGSVEVLDRLPERSAQALVKEVAEEIIGHEEILHEERLARLVGNTFGLDRVATARRSQILACVHRGHRVSNEPEFLAPLEFDPTSWRKVREGILEYGPKLEEVSLVEIANAMAVSAERSFSLEQEDLYRAALNLLGGTRLTSKIRLRLDGGIATALRLGRLSRDDDGHFAAVP